MGETRDILGERWRRGGGREIEKERERERVRASKNVRERGLEREGKGERGGRD